MTQQRPKYPFSLKPVDCFIDDIKGENKRLLLIDEYVEKIQKMKILRKEEFEKYEKLFRDVTRAIYWLYNKMLVLKQTYRPSDHDNIKILDYIKTNHGTYFFKIRYFIDIISVFLSTVVSEKDTTELFTSDKKRDFLEKMNEI